LIGAAGFGPAAGTAGAVGGKVATGAGVGSVDPRRQSWTPRTTTQTETTITPIHSPRKSQFACPGTRNFGSTISCFIE
jgi:hypothetical protein